MEQLKEKIAALESQIKRQQRRIFILFILVIVLQTTLIVREYREQVFANQVAEKLEILYKQAIQMDHLIETLID